MRIWAAKGTSSECERENEGDLIGRRHKHADLILIFTLLY